LSSAVEREARRRALASGAAVVAGVVFSVLTAAFWIGASMSTEVAHEPAWARLTGEVAGWGVLPGATLVLGLTIALAGGERAAVFLVGAVAGAGLLAYGVRAALHTLDADGGGGRISEFPSTHATTAVAFAGALTVLVWVKSTSPPIRIAATLCAVAASVLVAWSRVATGSHTRLDVVGGIALGVAWLATWALALATISSRRTWLAITLGASLAGFAFFAIAYDHDPFASADRDAATWVSNNVPTWSQSLARPPSWLGDWIGLTVLGVVMVVLLARERAWFDLAFFASAVVGSQIAVAVLKALFDRPRPDVGSAIPLPSSPSFPSGHATTGVASFGALAVLAAERISSRRARVWLWTVFAVIGVSIGASRVVLDVHYVTDVLGGWCLGLAWLAACLLVRDAVRTRAKLSRI
jgi:undecaprenyl-diphosphatase